MHAIRTKFDRNGANKCLFSAAHTRPKTLWSPGFSRSALSSIRANPFQLPLPRVHTHPLPIPFAKQLFGQANEGENSDYANLPGFRMPLGSRAVLIFACKARTSGVVAGGHHFFFASPMPCSPVITPPMASVPRKRSSSAASQRALALG